MPKVVTPLSATQLNGLKPKDKAYTVGDGNGLQILVKANGSKLWEYIYTSPTLNKRRKTSFGTYPQVSLLEARTKRDEYNKLRREGIDPLELKHSTKIEQQELAKANSNTLRAIATEWMDHYSKHISEGQATKIMSALHNHVFTYLGDKPIADVTPKDIIEPVMVMVANDKYETASRVLNNLNRIYKYGVTMQYTPHNIIADIDKQMLIGKKIKKHYPTMTKEKDIKGVLLSIDDYQGELTTQYAMKILPYLFVRSSNIRSMEWSEIDFDKEIWNIPASKMKTKIEFNLPLPQQVITLLKEYQSKTHTSPSELLFPSIRDNSRPLSDNTLISALRRMGYTKEELVPHSFRSIFSTIAYEHMNHHGYTGEVIEALLAHKETNKVKEAYNRATYKEPMRQLMQWYADYLDGLKQ